MKIGLVRHYKVSCAPKRRMTSSEFAEWVKEYDVSGVIENNLKINENDWDICYTSDLYRAKTTAKSVYKGEITETPLLREIPAVPPYNTNFKLHTNTWFALSRIAWFNSHHSQVEMKADTVKRVEDILNIIHDQEKERVLLVCHGFLMRIMSRKLIRSGYKGKKLYNPKNAVLYEYTKD